MQILQKAKKNHPILILSGDLFASMLPVSGAATVNHLSATEGKAKALAKQAKLNGIINDY